MKRAKNTENRKSKTDSLEVPKRSADSNGRLIARPSVNLMNGRENKMKTQLRNKKESKLWRPKNLGDIFVERKMKIRIKGRKSSPVLVQIGRPIRESSAKKNDPWACPFRIKGFHPDFESCVWGIDSLQALVIALDFVDKILPSMSAGKEGKVEFLGPEAPLVYNDWPVKLSQDMDNRIERNSKPRKKNLKIRTGRPNTN
jgi:uncharacterized protein DUF6968